MKKAEILEHWRRLRGNQPITMRPVPYKHEGSTYDQDGIRITGSKQFIDSILSRIKDLLDHENDNTRLQLVYKRSVDKDTGEELDSYNCYIQVHERGQEARICNAVVRGLREAA